MAEEVKDKKIYSRRLWASVVWGVINFALVIAQPVLGCDTGVVTLFVEKSTWVVGLLVIGLSSTDVVAKYISK